MTLIGAGGIGKTRLGREVGRCLFAEFADGVWLAELAPLSDPDLVPAIVAVALGLDLGGGPALAERVARALNAKQLMLLLDNCEHVIDAAANMAEALLHANSAVRVLATSREPLRIEGECLYRVPALAVPTAGAAEAAELLQYGAVRLFVARARTADIRFSPEGHAASEAAAICRRLDGIPLAIELAAARSGTLGIAEVSSRLDDRFQLLTNGQRTALPRHQTLRATLDWSYELLSKPERLVLRSLGIFAGSFSLAAASAIASDPEINAAEVIDCIAKLITKSLVAANGDDVIAHYRLLETTRAYALEQLAHSGEADAVARRHADYYLQLCDQVAAGWETTSAVEPVAAYSHHVDNLRMALDWAFSPSGDASLAVALTVASVPLWFRLSLMQECYQRVERALAVLPPGSSRNAHYEIHLYSALAASLPYIKGVVPEYGAAWKKALEIAESLGDAEYQLRALWGLWDFCLSDGQYRTALEYAQKFHGLAERQVDLGDRLISDRLIGVTQHYLGDQANARRHIERMLSRHVALARPDIIRFRSDQRVQARAYLARVLWLQGLPDQAICTADSSIEDARSVDHAISVCFALVMAACPVAFYVGDLTSAERYVRMLHDHAARHGPAVWWQAWGRNFEAVLVIGRGDVIKGLQYLRAGLDEVGRRGVAARFLTFQGILADALSRVGQVSDGLAAIDKGLDWSERTEGRWAIAELLRIKGELLLLQGGSAGVAAAEEHFRQSIEGARQQGALSWELRAATSLARLRRDQGAGGARHGGS